MKTKRMTYRISLTLLFALCLTIIPVRSGWAGGMRGSQPKHHGLELSTGTRAAECGLCHQRQYSEWRYAADSDIDIRGEGSYHAVSSTEEMYTTMLNTVGPELRSYCQGCHESASAPAVVDKVTQIPEPRTVNIQEGINCLVCHFNGERILGPDALSDALFCAACHNEGTGLVDVYEAWLHDYQGEKTCQECHMERGSHVFAGYHSPSFRQKALSISEPVFSAPPTADTAFSVSYSVTNDGTGHSVPEDLFRTLRIRTAIEDSNGQLVYSQEKIYYKRNTLFGEDPAETEIIRAGEAKTIKCPDLRLPGGLYTLKIEIEQDSNRVNSDLNTTLGMTSMYLPFQVL